MAHITFIQYLDREWFETDNLIEFIKTLQNLTSFTEIRPLVIQTLKKFYPRGVYADTPEIQALLQDKSIEETALMTYLLHVMTHVPTTTEELYKDNLERQHIKKLVARVLKKGEGRQLSELMTKDELIQLYETRAHQKVPPLNLQDHDILDKILDRSKKGKTLNIYNDSVTPSEIYLGDIILLHVYDSINKRNRVHLETEFYTRFNPKDYYFIPKDTIKKMIKSLKSIIDERHVEQELRPNMRTLIHYLLEQYIYNIALKTKKFLDVYKSTHSNSTLSYKTMLAYKELSG